MNGLGNMGLLSGRLLRGIDQVSAKKLIESINEMTEKDQRQVIDTLTKADLKVYQEGALTSDKEKYQARIAQLPIELATRLLTGSEQLVDSEIYSVVALGATATSITDMFTQDGAKSVGIRNISNQKPDADKYFLLTAIELLYGIDAEHSGLIGTFSTALMPAIVLNGEIAMTQNGRTIIQKQSLHMFFNGIQAATVTNADNVYQARNIHKLNNPKWLYPQQEIKCSMEWGHAGGAANSYLKLRLIGVVNERA